MSDEFDHDYLWSLISEEEAAEFLGYSRRSLQNWRHRGGGPVYIQVSPRSVKYTRGDLLEWCDDRRRTNTSQ